MTHKTLLVCFGPLGRLLQSFCAARRLRDTEPEQQLVLLTDPSLVGLAARAPWFDDIVSANMSAPETNLSLLTKTIKQNQYDRIIDLERSPRSAKFFSGFGFFPPAFASHASRAKWSLVPQNIHPIDEDDQLLDLMGIPKTSTDLTMGPQLDWVARLSANAPSLQPAYFGLEPPFVLLNLVPITDEESWSAEKYEELAGKILATETMLAITGNIEARELAKKLIRKFPQIRDLCARADPFQLAALGGAAKGVVGLPNGILHLCAAGGGRCISLHNSETNARNEAIRSPNALTLTNSPLCDLSADDLMRTMKMFGAL